MASYTPGPWNIEVIHPAEGAYTISHGVNKHCDGPAGTVAKVYCSEADARLIAAAPQMLNVLKVIRFTSYIKKFLLDMDPQAYRLIDWVINNAEGAEAK